MAELLAPYPFLFLEAAFTTTFFPALIPFIVHFFFNFLIVHDFPPAVTLLPVIFDPPVTFGKLIDIVKLTFPFLAFEETIELIVGAEGFVIFVLLFFAFAGTALTEPSNTIVASVSAIFLIVTLAPLLKCYTAFFKRFENLHESSICQT
jgi:hypothetical protein